MVVKSARRDEELISCDADTSISMIGGSWYDLHSPLMLTAASLRKYFVTAEVESSSWETLERKKDSTLEELGSAKQAKNWQADKKST